MYTHTFIDSHIYMKNKPWRAKCGLCVVICFLAGGV